MDKEDTVHTHTGILFSYKRNALESVLMWWMNLESIIYSAVREKQVSKRKTNILMHIYGIYKNGTDEPIRREGKETQM